MKSRYYIVGIKHCGKSTIGKTLAKTLGIQYFDLDDLIEDSVKMSVRDFYRENGKDAFQREETKALKKLESSDTKRFICATGGGICDNDIAFSILKDLKIIYINTSFTTVYNRIIRNGIPPFLKSDDPRNEFFELYKKRTEKYRSLKSVEVSGEGTTPFQITEEILKNIKE